MDIGRKTGITYSHVWHIILKLEQMGFVTRHTSGRYKFIEMTEKGREFCDSCSSIYRIFNGIEDAGTKETRENNGIETPI